MHNVYTFKQNGNFLVLSSFHMALCVRGYYIENWKCRMQKCYEFGSLVSSLNSFVNTRCRRGINSDKGYHHLIVLLALAVYRHFGCSLGKKKIMMKQVAWRVASTFNTPTSVFALELLQVGVSICENIKWIPLFAS